jgi:hypothetical protein
MKKLRSPPDNPGEGKVYSKSSKRHKSSANERMTRKTKNKGKEKVVENFVDNKVSCRLMVLQYISISTRKESQSSFTEDEKKINKGLKNLTLLANNLALNNVSKPLLKGFVHQTEVVVTNLKGHLNKWVNGFNSNAYKLLARAGYSYKDINNLANDDNKTQLKGKQVSIKTRKV